jgi:hypothetical protein
VKWKLHVGLAGCDPYVPYQDIGESERLRGGGFSRFAGGDGGAGDGEIKGTAGRAGREVDGPAAEGAGVVEPDWPRKLTEMGSLGAAMPQTWTGRSRWMTMWLENTVGRATWPRAVKDASGNTNGMSARILKTRLAESKMRSRAMAIWR